MQIKKFSLTFALGAVVLLASNVAAHGRFLEPPTRIAEGDENQGFTKTRGPTNEEPCAGVPFQGVKSQFSPGQTIPISWEIGAAHRGTCFLQLSTDNAATFQTIKEFPNCADSNGIFNDQATLPSGVSCEQCVLRWRWEAALTNELYLNCADISIGGGGGGQPPAGDQPPPPSEPQQPGEQPGEAPAPAGEPQPGAEPTAQPSAPTEPQPPTDGEPQPPTDGEPQPPTGTDGNPDGQLSRRSAPRRRPRRLRRSAW